MKNLSAKILLAENSILGLSVTRSSARYSEAIVTIDKPSNRLSTSIVSFGYSPLSLRNCEHKNCGWQLLKKVSSKLQLCGFYLCLVQDLYGRDITIQTANWLADGRAPRLVRLSLSALRWNIHDIITP